MKHSAHRNNTSDVSSCIDTIDSLVVFLFERNLIAWMNYFVVYQWIKWGMNILELCVELYGRRGCHIMNYTGIGKCGGGKWISEGMLEPLLGFLNFNSLVKCVCVSVCLSVCLCLSDSYVNLFVWLSVRQFVCCCVCFACMPTVLTVLIYVKWCWQLLVGDDKAFQELKERYQGSCPHWYHMMVGKLLFSYPTIISSDYELIHVAEVTDSRYAIALK